MAVHLITNSMRELAVRTTDGLEVRLLWCERESRLAVQVADAKTGHVFVIDVREGERAMDVFHHPFAYAAWHGVPTDAASQGDGPQAHRLAA